MANMTITTLAQQIETLWTPEVNRAVKYNLVLGDLFDDKSSLLKTGNTLRLPTRHNLTPNAKAAGVSLTPEAITETKQDFTVPITNGHRAVAFEIEDIAEIQTKYDARAEYTDSATYALSRQFDKDCAVLFTSVTNYSTGTLGSELLDDDFIYGRNNLSLNSAPQPWCIAISTTGYGALLKIDKFVNQLYNGDPKGAAVSKAKVGMLYGAEVYEAPAVNLASTSPNADACMWAKPHFIKIVQRKPTVHTLYQPLDVAWVVSMDMLYGVFDRQEADEASGVATTADLWAVRLRTLQ